jgi:predicted enzyme related to lactoylglutathione lyase
MTSGPRTIIFPVSDLARAKEVFGALLGVAPSMDAPYYVQFDHDDHQVGLDPRGRQQGLTGPVAYWTVDDIEKSLQTLIDAGAQQVQGVHDVGGGRRIATVTDPDGNPIGLMQDC